jgi:nucleotide-binding universal stress UspA family protein
MYKKMLVPLDGSALAETIVPYATEVAGRLGLELVLLHVCVDNWSETEHLCQVYLDHVANLARKESRKIQVALGTGQAPVVKAQAELLVGDPAEEIIRYAEGNNVDFILIASHGHSGVRRWVLGNVVDKVLRASKVPVWVVRASALEAVRDQWAMQKILVPLDGSKAAEAVLPHVTALARQKVDGATAVTLIRVYERPFITADYPEPDWEAHIARMTEFFKKEAVQYLTGIEKRLAAKGLKVKSEVLVGKPAEEIIRYAETGRPDLLVLSTHGASGLSHWEYGDIAERVLYGVSRPVFLLRI